MTAPTLTDEEVAKIASETHAKWVALGCVDSPVLIAIHAAYAAGVAAGEARIAELEAEKCDAITWCMLKARAEKAEARIAELEKALVAADAMRLRCVTLHQKYMQTDVLPNPVSEYDAARAATKEKP